MVQEYIEIRGARENNLKDVSLRLPKRKIIMFTGVSGSGKSSLVFDTIANEAQRLLFENFSLFIRNLLPRYPQPDADAIENLSMAVLVDQKRLGGGSHSTVGTVTDIASVLRLLFSRIGKPYVGSANAFSFNDPQGMCPECNGLGRKIGITPEALIDKTRSLNEGAVIAPGLANWESDLYGRSGFFDNDKKIAEYTQRNWTCCSTANRADIRVWRTTPMRVWCTSSIASSWRGTSRRSRLAYGNRSSLF